MYSDKYTAPCLRERYFLPDGTTRIATFLDATVILLKQCVFLDETSSENA